MRIKAFKAIKQDSLIILDLIVLVIFETIIKTKIQVLSLFLMALRIYLEDSKNNRIDHFEEKIFSLL